MTDACMRNDDGIVEIDRWMEKRLIYLERQVYFQLISALFRSAQRSCSLHAGVGRREREANDSIFDRQRKQSEEIRRTIDRLMEIMPWQSPKM